METVLKSKQNPLAQRFRLAASRARGAPRDLVLAEGIRVLEEATLSGLHFDSILVSPAFGRNPRETTLMQKWRIRGWQVRRADVSLLKSISDVVANQGALALVELPKLSLEKVDRGPEPLVLVAAGIQDPGNLGALIRTAAASGVSWISTTPGTVSVRNPKCVRSSAGFVFRVPIVEGIPARDLLAFLGSEGIALHCASAAVGLEYTGVDYRRASAIVFGNESRGVPESEWGGAPRIRIPMLAGVESLNVASAGAVVLFEAARQRQVVHASSTSEPGA